MELLKALKQRQLFLSFFLELSFRTALSCNAKKLSYENYMPILLEQTMYISGVVLVISFNFLKQNIINIKLGKFHCQKMKCKFRKIINLTRFNIGYNVILFS